MADWHWEFAGERVSHPGVVAADLADQPLGDELPLWQRANSYECPVGPRPGRGWLLMTRERVDNIDQATVGHEIIVHSPFETVTLRGMVIVQTLSMFGQADKAESPMLVYVEDRRNIPFTRSSINKGYNVPMGAPSNTHTLTNITYPETMDGGALWTWQKMLDDIWGHLTDVGAAPTLSITPSFNPSNLRFYGMNAWDALHAALSVIGFTSAFDPIEDDFQYVRPDVDTLSIPANRLMQDFDPVRGAMSGNAPASIAVHFPKRAKWTGIERDTPRTDNWEVDPVHTITVVGVSGGRGTMSVNSDVEALYNHDGVITTGSLSQITGRANDIAASIRKRYDLEKRFVISGPTKVNPATHQSVKQVTWRDYGDDVGQVSIIERLPCPAQEDLDGNGSGGAAGERVPAYDSVKPGDWGRRSHPVWPRMMQVVQVYAQGSAGTPVQPTLGNIQEGSPQPAYLHLGRVRLIRAGLEVLEQCYILVLNDFDQLKGNLELNNHELYHGRLSGTAAIGQTEYPLYTVKISEQDLYKFEAINCKDPGKSAVGKLLKLNRQQGTWDDTGDLVTAEDPDFLVSLIPGERHRIHKITASRWEFWGEHRLTRRVTINQGAYCGASTNVSIRQHAENVCTATTTDCSTTACNGELAAGFQPLEEGRRYMHPGEVATMGFFERRWVINAQPRANWAIASLVNKLCPSESFGDTQNIGVLDYCVGAYTATLVNAQLRSQNTYNHAGKAQYSVLLLLYSGSTGTDHSVITDIQARCYDPLVDDEPCEGEQATDVGEAIDYEDCKLKTHRLPKTRLESCEDEDWFDDKVMYSNTVLANARIRVAHTVGSGSGDDVCQLKLEAQLHTFCSFDAQEADPPYVELSSHTMIGQDVYYSYQTANRCVLLLKRRIPILCAGEEVGSDTIICGVPCGGSGSGS